MTTKKNQQRFYDCYGYHRMEKRHWIRVGDKDFIEIGRVTTVTAETETICLTRTKEGYGAICNQCPHQGGPLGDGFLQNGYVVCPWHGYEFDPKTGNAPEGYEDKAKSFPVEVREDGIYIGVEQKIQEKTLMDQVVETMVEWGITKVFGIVGHSNLGLANSIAKAAQKGKLNYIGVRHEGAASFAASAYAKLTGRPAACFSIAGPGATNMLTGLWDANLDNVPILALTGQVNTQVLGPGAFQEIPLLKAYEAVTVWSQQVLTTSNATELTALAVKHAINKKGVGHLIFPDEVQTLPADPNCEISLPKGRLANNSIRPPIEDIEKMIKLILEAKRPVLIVGNGGRNHADVIIKFAEHIEVPIITTFKAKGIVADSHPLACGVLGRSGTPVASAAMNRSDLLIVIGASFSNHTSINSHKPIIQIDFDKNMLAKFHPVTLPVWGEIETTVELLLDRIPKLDHTASVKYIATRWIKWREEKIKREQLVSQDLPSNALIFHTLSELIPQNSVIAVDVGNNTYSFGIYFESKNQHILMSGYLGSIGFAFPAAIGAAVAKPDEKIIAIAGDGGFGQYMAEFTTAVKYDLNITLILLNNNEFGKITREQRNSGFQVWETNLTNPDFAEFANNCGGTGLKIKTVNDLKKTLDEGINTKGPVLVEILSTSGQL